MNPFAGAVRIFVGGLPPSATEESVMSLFMDYGTIEKVSIAREGGICKGYGFVVFALKEDAVYCINALDGRSVMAGGRKTLQVRFAKSGISEAASLSPPVSSLGGGILEPPSWRQRGSDESSHLSNMPPYPVEVGGPPGLTGGDVNDIEDNEQIEQKEDSSDAAWTEVSGPPGANIFVFHIPNEWTRHDLVREFGKFGKLMSTQISTARATGRTRGYGFVSFCNIASALVAVRKMNHFAIYSEGGNIIKRLKVTIKKGQEPAAREYAMKHYPSWLPSLGLQPETP
jgi:RNA recognition motif-containing protein